MNFFAQSGQLDLTGVETGTSKVKVTDTKSIHSSEDELDRREDDPGKTRSVNRRQRTRALSSRKNNKEFRSVWYDTEEMKAPPKTGMRKATSLDNLLDVGPRFKTRCAVTKEMISSPIRPRKILDNWTEVKEVDVSVSEQIEVMSVRRKLSDTVEAASAALEYFSKMFKKSGSPGGTLEKRVHFTSANAKPDGDKEKHTIDSEKEQTTSLEVRTSNEDGAEKENITLPIESSKEKTEISDVVPLTASIENDESKATEFLSTFSSKEVLEIIDETEQIQPIITKDSSKIETGITSCVNLAYQDTGSKEKEETQETHKSNAKKEEETTEKQGTASKETNKQMENVTHSTDIVISLSAGLEEEKVTYQVKSIDKNEERALEIQVQTEVTMERNTDIISFGESSENAISDQVEPSLEPVEVLSKDKAEKITEDHPSIVSCVENIPKIQIDGDPAPEKKDEIFEPNHDSKDTLDSPQAKNGSEASEALELQTFIQKATVTPDMSKLQTPAGNEVHFKKHGTLEAKWKFRRGGKIEISQPTQPRTILVSGEEVDLTALDSEDVTNLLKMKLKSKSTSDLLKSLHPIKNERPEQLSNPKFPISETDETDGDEVQIRRNQSITHYRCSKTTDFDFGRKWTNNSKDFEVKGITKLLVSSDTSPIKLKKTDVLKYQNGNFYKIDDISRKALKANVILKGARLLNKRDVELKDSNNISYVLFFDNSKDAKAFIESEKIRCYTENDNKSTITKTLLRLLGKRSSREVLEKKGIYQNEPIFGNTLRNIYNTEKGVPHFILRTMELIEFPENITSLGIYRTSGNLATIQKIRFEVDKGRLSILNEFCKDVDVLTGCLKLFFRELKEPLIPCDVAATLLSKTKRDNVYSKTEKSQIRQIITKLPEANSETLYVLIRHLLEVVKYKDENKMDTYNLSVCWGPTIIFNADPTAQCSTRDAVAQTTDATRLFDALLTYYMAYPEELDFGRKVQDYLDNNRNPIQRQDSKDSIKSFDSNTSKTTQKKSGSNLSLNVDEVLKKTVELIEMNINSEGLYKKSGSTEKINKIVKRMMKKKVGELERHKSDTNELTDSLKKYLREAHEPLVTQECVDQVNKFCDNGPCLEPNNRQRIISEVESLPKKDTFIYLLKHIIRVMEHESQHNVSKTDMISIWTNVLNHQRKTTESNERFSRFLRTALDVFDDSKADVMPSPKGFSNGLLNDLKNYQKDKDRVSKYDNVPDSEGNILREATIMEEKTEDAEQTKL